VGSKQQSLILRVLAAILHLGNVELEEGNNEGTKIDQNSPSLGYVCELLGVEKSQLAQWLCYRRIQTVGDVFDKPLRIDEAQTAKDALAKHIYAQLFDMIVEHVNTALITKD
jgi:myosin-5